MSDGSQEIISLGENRSAPILKRRGLTHRTEGHKSLLVVPRTTSLVPLTEEEQEAINTHMRTALALQDRAETALLEKTGDFRERGGRETKTITNITERDLTLETGEEESQTVESQAIRGKAGGLFSVWWQIDRDTTSGTKGGNTKKVNEEKTAIHDAAVSETTTLQRETVTGRHLTANDVTLASQAVETVLDAGQIFNPAKAKELIEQRQAFFARLLTEFGHTGDRPDLIKAVEQSAYQIAQTGLERLTNGLPESTMQRVDGAIKPELAATYQQISLMELIYGFDTLLACLENQADAPLLQTIINNAFEFNENLGNRLLAKWANRLSTLSSGLQAGFFDQYAQMFMAGVNQHQWDLVKQNDFLLPVSFCWPAINSESTPENLRLSLRNFFLNAYKTASDEALRIWLTEQMYKFGSEKIHWLTSLFAEEKLPVTKNFICAVADLIGSDLARLNKKEMIKSTADYLLAPLGSGEADARAAQAIIQGVRNGFKQTPEWQKSMQQYDESERHVTVAVELGHGQAAVEFSPATYVDFQDMLSRFPVALTKIELPSLINYYKGRDLEYVFFEEIELQKDLQLVFRLPLTEGARLQLTDFLTKYLQDRLKTLSGRTVGMVLSSDNFTESWQFVNSIFQIVPQLREIIGEERFQQATADFLPNLVSNGRQEAEISQRLIEDFIVIVQNSKLGFKGRQFNQQLQELQRGLEEGLQFFQQIDFSQTDQPQQILKQMRDFYLKLVDTYPSINTLLKEHIEFAPKAALLGKAIPPPLLTALYARGKFINGISTFVRNPKVDKDDSTLDDSALEESNKMRGILYTCMSEARVRLADRFKSLLVT